LEPWEAGDEFSASEAESKASVKLENSVVEELVTLKLSMSLHQYGESFIHDKTWRIEL
jgi:hypothetical protein